MSFAPKIASAVFLAVSVLSLLLLASSQSRPTSTQQPDYTAQCSNGVVVPNPQNNPGLVQDCAALLAARDAFAADPPLEWSADISIFDWYGIGLESTLEGAFFRNRVVVVFLESENLTGSISPKLGDLTYLQELFLNDNQVTGSIPPELGNLANLDGLYLYDNQLTGSMPPELGNLANLDSLFLYDNQLIGSIPPELGNLANLKRLYLYDNQLTGSLPPELGNLVNLERLYLNSNQFSGSIPPELGNLGNLWDLHLNDNQLSGSIPPELGNLGNLWGLYLSGNQLTGCIPAVLGSLRNHDFGELGLPLCAASDAPTPVPTPTREPTPESSPQPTPTREPTPTTVPTATSVPATPTVPDEVLNRISALETLVATLQSLIETLNGTVSALASRVTALEADASIPTPVPIPTQTPVADSCLTSIPSDGATNGSWNNACTTDRNLFTPYAPVGTRYAGYYTFTLSQQSEVTITLESSEDTYLFLLEGAGRSGSVIAQNDDIDTAAQNYNSRIAETLDAGEYTILATTYNLATTGNFTLTVSGIR